jgi:hypothetical protein
LDTASKFAVLGGFIFTGFTFWITRKRLKHLEQIKMAHDISKELKETENEALKIPSDFAYQDQKRPRHIQYLNVWEWFAFLVNHKDINDESIINHFKPTLIRDYKTILSKYTDLMENEKAFEEIKFLCEKWKQQAKNQN